MFEQTGFITLPNIYTNSEIENILSVIDSTDFSNSTFRKSKDLFAIRQFLKEIPQVIPFVFNEKLKALIKKLFGDDFFVVKSIYFDKPEQSNWFVAYHQDLTISVDKKIELANYGPWTVKQDQFAVQPPLEILQNIFTIRIHLDDTDENNGPLKVILGSHAKGIYRAETIDWTKETETTCTIEKGGVMIMKPLLLHSSSRTTNNNKRRVIHVEFSNQQLPDGLNWSEFLSIFN
ncbi:MAG: phytanoyl-CoA dioxygenase family protein [Bacteroidetes bacterium]|nr:phytanoyl-CoA dioxygenase family protein [Bacteroidota bacterium]